MICDEVKTLMKIFIISLRNFLFLQEVATHNADTIDTDCTEYAANTQFLLFHNRPLDTDICSTALASVSFLSLTIVLQHKIKCHWGPLSSHFDNSVHRTGRCVHIFFIAESRGYLWTVLEAWM